jgi:tRNA synthetases class I (E and Q), anti-codon binding domain
VQFVYAFADTATACHLQKSVVEAYGDLNMRSLAKGDVIQLERKGYWIVDQAADPSDPQKVKRIAAGVS